MLQLFKRHTVKAELFCRQYAKIIEVVYEFLETVALYLHKHELSYSN
jgi:hypothetical protein